MNPRGFGAENHREKITGNSPFFTLAVRVPQRDCSAGVEVSLDFQRSANSRNFPGKESSVSVVFAHQPRLLVRKDGFWPTTGR